MYKKPWMDYKNSCRTHRDIIPYLYGRTRKKIFKRWNLTDCYFFMSHKYQFWPKKVREIEFSDICFHVDCLYNKYWSLYWTMQNVKKIVLNYFYNHKINYLIEEPIKSYKGRFLHRPASAVKDSMDTVQIKFAWFK